MRLTGRSSTLPAWPVPTALTACTLQHRLTTQLEDAEHDALDIVIRALPACELRRAWLDCD
eukprot:6322292-Prymnesium_polylepis.1